MGRAFHTLIGPPGGCRQLPGLLAGDQGVAGVRPRPPSPCWLPHTPLATMRPPAGGRTGQLPTFWLQWLWSLLGLRWLLLWREPPMGAPVHLLQAVTASIPSVPGASWHVRHLRSSGCLPHQRPWGRVPEPGWPPWPGHRRTTYLSGGVPLSPWTGQHHPRNVGRRPLFLCSLQVTVWKVIWLLCLEEGQ